MPKNIQSLKGLGKLKVSFCNVVVLHQACDVPGDMSPRTIFKSVFIRVNTIWRTNYACIILSGKPQTIADQV